jgi:hypothetical protein
MLPPFYPETDRMLPPFHPETGRVLPPALPAMGAAALLLRRRFRPVWLSLRRWLPRRWI